MAGGVRPPPVPASGVSGGLAVELAGLVASVPLVTTAGRIAVLLGAVLYSWLVLALFYERHWRDVLPSWSRGHSTE